MTGLDIHVEEAFDIEPANWLSRNRGWVAVAAAVVAVGATVAYLVNRMSFHHA